MTRICDTQDPPIYICGACDRQVRFVCDVCVGAALDNYSTYGILCVCAVLLNLRHRSTPRKHLPYLLQPLIQTVVTCAPFSIHRAAAYRGTCPLCVHQEKRISITACSGMFWHVLHRTDILNSDAPSQRLMKAKRLNRRTMR